MRASDAKLVEKGLDRRTGYLVTAKHLYIDWIKSRKSYVRLNLSAESGGGTYDQIISSNENDWCFHDDASVDVAVTPFTPDNPSIRCNFLGIEYNVATEENYKSFQLVGSRLAPFLKWPLEEGERIIYVALMPKYSGIKKN